jgi:glycosyltransferase involved in cell wall biosynthesis
MNISIITGSFYPSFYYGGPVFSLLYTSKELAAIGNIVYVSTTNANGYEKLDVQTNKSKEFDKNVFVKYYGMATYSGFSWPLLLSVWYDILKSDVVFLQPIFSSFVPVSLLYARLFNKPVLLSPRGSLGDWCLSSRRSTIKQLWFRYLIAPFCKYVVWHATSEQEKREILALVPDAEVCIIPNGVSLCEFSTATRIAPVEYTRRFVGKEIDCAHIIISMGRIHIKKGFDILIDAFARVRSRFPRAVLLIAGPDGGELSNLQMRVDDLALKDCVFFIGELSGKDKIDFLANGDLFVLPSHNENFGNVYAESLAVGTPVIASRQTPWEEVETYGCGRWINNTVEEVAIAMQSMLESDLDLAGKQAVEYIRNTFDWSSIGEKFHAELSRMVKAHYE